MDCLQAQQALSDAVDRAVDDSVLADARAHCADCAECASFARGLDALVRATAPNAPAALVERIVALGVEEASSIRETAHDVAQDARHDGRIVPFRRAWRPRFATIASVAAVLLVALVATGIGLRGLLVGEQAPSEVARTSAEYDNSTGAPLAAPGVDAAGSGASRDVTNPAAAPPYVVLDGLVYALTGQRTVNASSLVTETPIITALDTGADPVEIPAFRIAGESGTLVLRQESGTYLGFSTISRTFGGRRFVLTSGVRIAAYGGWPLLPLRFAVPTSPDGSPTFSFFGKDDAGVPVYVPAGGAPRNGFAVAPGTSADDPAAGNPNWTWWQPE
jgi:hypothetical protein